MEKALNESTLRSQATRQDYKPVKSRRPGARDVNDRGGFGIVDRDRNLVVAGERIDLGLADVGEWLAQ